MFLHRIVQDCVFALLACLQATSHRFSFSLGGLQELLGRCSQSRLLSASWRRMANAQRQTRQALRQSRRRRDKASYVARCAL